MRMIGAEFIKRYGETPIVTNAVGGAPRRGEAGDDLRWHRDFGRYDFGDAAGRAGGVDRGLMCNGLDRLEKLALSLEGVQQAFADPERVAKSAWWFRPSKSPTTGRARSRSNYARDRGGAAIPEHDQDHGDP